MKNIISITRMKKISLILSCLLSFVSIKAQDGLSNIFTVKAVVVDNDVRLRWNAEDYNLLRNGQQNGYVVLRRTSKDSSGEYIPDSLYLDTEVILDTIFPYSNLEWNNLTGLDSNVILSAKKILTDIPLMAGDSVLGNFDTLSNVKLSHALIKYNQNNNIHIITLALADQDYEVAKGLGLGYIDTTASNDFTYDYIIKRLNVVAVDTFAFCSVSVTSSNNLPSIDNLIGEGKHLIANLSWNINQLDKYYSYYNIYRSDDGIEFSKVNELPFIYLSQDKSMTSAFYTDSLPSNSTPYYFTVTGISPFGGEGPFSDTITVIGTPDPLPISIEILDAGLVDNELQLNWHIINKLDSLPPNISEITGYEIVYTPDLIQSPIVIDSVTDPNTFTISLDNPIDGYYFVEALDVNSYRYPSIPHLYQGLDSIPPNPPSNLTGVLNNQGHLKLIWDPNTEPDLEGYKVFYSYGAAGPYAQITKTYIKDTTYISELGTNFANDTIYYYVCAVDKRYNISEPSDSISLLLPDLVGPSRPIIRQLLPHTSGIRIGWSLSQDDDVTYHKLQRKVKEATTWNDILTILPSDSYPLLPKVNVEVNPSNYIDTDSLPLRIYSYRLIVFDQKGNYSVSDVYDAKPLYNGVRGKITSLDATIIGRGTSYNPTGITSTSNGITQSGISNTNVGTNHLGAVTGAYTSDGFTVRLNWQYNALYPGTLKDFSIYQKITIPPGSQPSGTPPPPFILLKKVTVKEGEKISAANSLTGYTWFVEGVKPFKYQDTNPNSLGVSGQVNFLSPIEYKVIANHTDGGFSREVIFILE